MVLVANKVAIAGVEVELVWRVADEGDVVGRLADADFVDRLVLELNGGDVSQPWGKKTQIKCSELNVLGQIRAQILLVGVPNDEEAVLTRARHHAVRQAHVDVSYLLFVAVEVTEERLELL